MGSLLLPLPLRVGRNTAPPLALFDAAKVGTKQSAYLGETAGFFWLTRLFILAMRDYLRRGWDVGTGWV
jgi:hypothetical protein